MSFDISRLQAQLNNTGLQNKNTPLYQFLNQLLSNLKNIDNNVTNVVNNPTTPITTINQILQSIALGDDNSNNDNNDLFVPGSQSGSAQNISILFSGEVPTGLINSSNKLFTTAHTYLTGFLAPYLNGVRQLITEDYTETSPTTFTFVNAPITGDIVLVDYVQVAGISGTAGSQGIQGIQGLSGNTIFGEDGLDGQDGFSIPGSSSSGGSAGALVLLEQHTAAASATLDFTTAITSLYDDYLIELINILPATDNVTMSMRLSVDGGATYDSGVNYRYTYHYKSTAAASGVVGSNGSTSFEICGNLDNAAAGGLSGFHKLFNPLSASQYKFLAGTVGFLHNDTNYYRTDHGSWYISVTAVNAIRFFMSSGNIASGIIRIYGITKV